MLRRNLLLSTALLAVASRAVSRAGFASRRSGVFAPPQMYGFTADLFTRSYFIELRSVPDWSADHQKWAQNLPDFASDVMGLLVPSGVFLAEHLAAELPKRVSQSDLAELEMLNERPATQTAIQRLERLGAGLDSLMQVQGIMRAPTLYSSAERANAKVVVQALRGQLPEAAAFKSDLAPLGEVMDSPAFKNYQSAIGGLFMADAGRLESTELGKQQFQALMQRWNLRLRS